MKVLIAAAGVGNGFFPLDAQLPKEMFPIIDKPILQYVVEEVVFSGIEEIVLVVNKEKKCFLIICC
ncbi:MAG: sugar phosphate nucleotidyltransferase [Patescibacteria group bacterium]